MKFSELKAELLQDSETKKAYDEMGKFNVLENRQALKYTYCVFWSEEDASFVATVAEFPSLAVVEDTQEEAFCGIVKAVDFLLDDMQSNGEKAPKPSKWKGNPFSC